MSGIVDIDGSSRRLEARTSHPCVSAYGAGWIVRCAVGFVVFATFAALGLGCEERAETSEEACEALAEERVTIHTRLDELDQIVRALPADAVRYADTTREELGRFTERMRDINARIDAMHDEHEVACKWPLIENGDFDAVMEEVYRPHIELVARQVEAVEAVAARLEKAGPPEVVGETVEGYRRTARLLREGLMEQMLVCETDFGDQSCRPYKDAVEAHFGKAAIRTGEGEDAPNSEQTAEENPESNESDDPTVDGE